MKFFVKKFAYIKKVVSLQSILKGEFSAPKF